MKIFFAKGEKLKDNNDITGALMCLKNPWPGMARTIYETYYSRFMETNNRPF
jgi:acyl-coenzyme A synthetase/AMP-(fatty) acid ligase